jgi:CheY-like chemotaxis protein
MAWALGSRSRPVYEALRARILSGEWPAGLKLPSYATLAAEFRVAPLTLRHVLGHLETEGLVARALGRGTFVRAQATPAVLIVDDEPPVRALLREHVRMAGYRPAEAGVPAEALAALERDPAIVLVLSDVRMPDRAAGVGFIRTVRRQWRHLPLAAVTGYPDDLAELHGTPSALSLS